MSTYSGGLRSEAVQSGATTILRLDGELDLATEPELDACLQHVLAGGAQSVAVDLRRLTFMDSSGIRAFISAERTCRERGVRFVLIRGSAAIDRLLALCGLDSFFTLVGEADDQLSAVSLAA
ncbi:MAG: STAS domain-containing protein [Solirubrobacteraceae bacterium]